MAREKKCYDGYLVQNLDAVNLLMPYILPRRTDSEVKVDLEFDLEKLENFIREQRKGDIPDLTLYHFIFAALARAAFEYPAINRFINHNRLYERRHVKISMIVKKTFAIDGKETSIMPVIEPEDSLAEIVQKIKKAQDEAMVNLSGDSNDFDRLTGILYRTPSFLLRLFVNFMLATDHRGHLPKSLLDIQPFHSSFFVTNMGSIGLPVIYHHLYEFGTVSGFACIGSKKVVTTVDRNGNITTKKVLPIRFTGDGRICDGYAYSCAFRTIARCFDKPEMLLKAYHCD